jgi:membrane protease subunit HflC
MRVSAILAIIVVGILIGLNSVYFVYEGEYGIIKRFDEVIEGGVKDEAGLGIKIPFIESKTSLTKKYVMLDIQQTDVLTLDMRSMTVDTYAVWHIVNPRLFLQTAATVPEGERRIENTVYGTLRTTISKKNQSEIIEARAGEYATLNDEVLTSSREALGNFGISLIDVQIKKFDLPESNRNTVFERMISERERIAARLRAEGEEAANRIRYEVDREKEIIVSEARAKAAKLEGEGESEFMRILATAYNNPERASFYEYLRTLDALRATMRGDKTLLMPGDSALTQPIIQPNSPRAGVPQTAVPSGE